MKMEKLFVPGTYVVYNGIVYMVFTVWHSGHYDLERIWPKGKDLIRDVPAKSVTAWNGTTTP